MSSSCLNQQRQQRRKYRRYPNDKRIRNNGMYNYSGRMIIRNINFCMSIVVVILASFSFLNCSTFVVLAQNPQQEFQVHDESVLLGEDSVVLITGSAGFIGSELAVALHHVFNVKKLICIDSITSPLKSALYQTTTNEDTDEDEDEEDEMSDLEMLQKDPDSLSEFEYKRQRIFNMLQTIGPKLHFYRADFRPSIPEYYDMGEVPLLDNIFNTHNDITHVVHLADAYSQTLPNDKQQAVPRVKDDIKSGMMESLLEQLKEFRSITTNAEREVPHFVYASSYEVYNHLLSNDENDNPNPPPFTEHKPITSASSLRGAAKLTDEILAHSYYNYHDITSVGLRFFNVYGPWGTPGSHLFEMAERTVTNSEASILDNSADNINDQRDYIYIDDAIDAILSAMQFRPYDEQTDKYHHPIVINVGTGTPSTLIEVANHMEQLFPRSKADQSVESFLADNPPSDERTISFAYTQRAQALLGFQPQYTLEKGLTHLLAWHYDRAFPYGQDTNNESTPAINQAVKKVGIESCSPFDKECLHYAAVFPCVSECFHTNQCISSIFDDAVYMSRFFTTQCDNVMYTIALGDDIFHLSSATVAIDPDSTSSFSRPEDMNNAQKQCNIAFVSETSALFQELSSQKGFTSAKQFAKMADQKSGNLEQYIVRHGFWTLVPVDVIGSTENAKILELLPKLSPGLFFSNQVKYAIFCDPDIIFPNVNKLIAEMKHNLSGGPAGGGVAMLIAENNDDDLFIEPGFVSPKEALQERTYQMVRVGLRGEIPGGGFQPLIDSSWIVHAVKVEDARLFRCDILNEVYQWNIGSDGRAIEFIMGLHDLWSKVVLMWDKKDPWWSKEEVEGKWRGILSSTSEKYFVRVISSELVGAVYSSNDRTNSNI